MRACYMNTSRTNQAKAKKNGLIIVSLEQNLVMSKHTKKKKISFLIDQKSHFSTNLNGKIGQIFLPSLFIDSKGSAENLQEKKFIIFAPK